MGLQYLVASTIHEQPIHTTQFVAALLDELKIKIKLYLATGK